MEGAPRPFFGVRGVLATVLALTFAGPVEQARGQGEQRTGGDAVRAEGIAALVGGAAPGSNVRVIYRSDVELRARMQKAGRSEGPLAMQALSANALRQALESLIREALIAREADRVQVAVPDEADVARAQRQLEKMAGGAERLGRLLELLGASEDEITTAARRRAKVRVFLEANLQGTADVTEAELERVYESGEHPFAGQKLEAVRDELRAWLARRALDRAVKRWVRVLRARTTVRVRAEYGGSVP